MLNRRTALLIMIQNLSEQFASSKERYSTSTGLNRRVHQENNTT